MSLRQALESLMAANHGTHLAGKTTFVVDPFDLHATGGADNKTVKTAF